MDVDIKRTVLLEYRNRNLALFETSMDHEHLKAAVMASGMLDGLSFYEDPYFEYFEAWSEASSALRDTITSEAATSLDPRGEHLLVPRVGLHLVLVVVVPAPVVQTSEGPMRSTGGHPEGGNPDAQVHKVLGSATASRYDALLLLPGARDIA